MVLQWASLTAHVLPWNSMLVRNVVIIAIVFLLVRTTGAAGIISLHTVNDSINASLTRGCLCCQPGTHTESLGSIVITSKRWGRGTAAYSVVLTSFRVNFIDCKFLIVIVEVILTTFIQVLQQIILVRFKWSSTGPGGSLVASISAIA